MLLDHEYEEELFRRLNATVSYAERELTIKTL